MARFRCGVSLPITLLAMSFVPGCGGKDAKPLQVALGMTGAEVEKILGEPQAKEPAGDGESVWRYALEERAVEITIRDDRVARILQMAVSKDETDMQGMWKIASAFEGGTPKGDRDPTGAVFIVGGGKMTIQEPDRPPEVAEFRLDPSASPKTIDILVSGFLRVNPTVRGIYALSGDDLKICFRKSGGPRPTAFESDPESGPDATLLALKRQSRQWSHPAAPPPMDKYKSKDKPKKADTKPAPITKDVPREKDYPKDAVPQKYDYDKMPEPKPEPAKEPDRKPVRVSGRVILDGKPVEGATVTFTPKDAVGREAQGTTTMDGSFVLSTLDRGDGAMPGTYGVALSKVAAPSGGPESKTPGEPRSLLPAKCADPNTSGLTATVKPVGTNEFEFLLRSK